MKIQIACFTAAGTALADRIRRSDIFEETFVQSFQKSRNKEAQISLQEWTKQGFQEKNALLFIGACGIAVRSIAPYVKSKLTDPPVLVTDEKGQFVIPLLSSHIGGAGELSKKLAAVTGGIPVLTTASDVNDTFAVDVFAKENDLFIMDMQKAREISAAAVAGKEIALYYPGEDRGLSEYLAELERRGIKGLHKVKYNDLKPGKWEEISKNKMESVVVSSFIPSGRAVKDGKLCKPILQLVPRNIVLGMGCRKGKTGPELLAFISDVLEELGVLREAVYCIASVDRKKEELGLQQAAAELGVSFNVYSRQELSLQQGDFSSSDFVKERIGVDNVCERAAAAAGAKRFLLRKRGRDGMTIAVGSL